MRENKREKKKKKKEREKEREREVRVIGFGTLAAADDFMDCSNIILLTHFG